MASSRHEHAGTWGQWLLGTLNGPAAVAQQLDSPYLLLNFSGCFSRMMWKRWAMEASCKEKWCRLERAGKQNSPPCVCIGTQGLSPSPSLPTP